MTEDNRKNYNLKLSKVNSLAVNLLLPQEPEDPNLHSHGAFTLGKKRIP